ncbi:MAG: helix-turn-helix transcriptional regulator [Flavobacteriales bacterium]|nr:helix-turn-helix transcriptional regulator [Flavobacteriales bacterium]
MSDNAIVNHICSQLRQLRLNQNITQEQLAERSGLGRATISRIEKGQAISLLTLVQLLRALNRLDLLETFQQVTPEISPLQLLKEQKPQRYRASGKRHTSDKGTSEW